MIERFIYRLSKSKYRDKLILKGALMFIAWDLAETRATRDIDLLGRTSNTIENITQIVKEICEIDCLEDAANFLTDSVECTEIQKRSEYQGFRVRFFGDLARSRTKMQIDIGFGDIVSPHPQNLEYPTLIGMSSPLILGYTPESVIAEKTHAMMKLGLMSSRIKDYYDVWFLSQQFPFDGSDLSEAINQTFSQRKMSISDLKLQIFQEISFDDTKYRQWNSFIEKNQLLGSTKTFTDVMNQIESFINPIFECNQKEFKLMWVPPGPWK
jgi:hypothetical protein